MAKANPIEVQKALKNTSYPADKPDLVETAKRNGADKRLVKKIAAMPGDRFDGPNDVEKAMFE
ncbi:DUF2795 domain-containing protein [Streptomyces marincola]|uniref:DUF2795 domain-containing protein n=2 Tax=Streptomyces marincola TaxID=2878388 RepID=A0A1W7D569_9ACTN|nr:DUF2795 domain-containing protein [Streptomyces marincola]ARQ72107.1 hypothetical protein CAG99_02065 [Streptomyces marincola]UCM91987.1 DUF2795 domain-containing protein [Streptomyces marincola]